MSLHLQKTDIFMKLIDEGKIPLRPGILRLVDEAIAAGVRLAVCSTSNEKAVSNLVYTLMGMERAVKFQVFAGDMVKAKKPAPDIYLMAVDEMGLEKERCVIIEDSHIGVGSAVAAGISCLVTKSSYTANEDFTGAKLIVDELGDDANNDVTLDTLTCLLDNNADSEECATSWDSVGHIEKGGASWAGARLGDANINKPAEYTASETCAASPSRGIGVKMEAHVEKGGASWAGARFGDDNPNKPARYTASETYEAASQSRGIGVQMEAHVERGGASWTGARFGDDSNAASVRSSAYTAAGAKGLGVKVESHVEKGGSSWSGARFGDDNPNKPARYTASETYEAASQSRGIGVQMEAHVERGGASWTGARFGDDSDVASVRSSAYTAAGAKGLGVKVESHVEKGGSSWAGARFSDDKPTTVLSTAQAPNPSGLGVEIESHIERGGASWTGARFGEDNPNKPQAYSASETYEFKSKGKSAGVQWDAAAHTEVRDDDSDQNKWSGARLGDQDARRCAPTPSQWHE